MPGVTDVDLVDLDRFANGFPHDVFTRLRAHAPVWWHPPHPKACPAAPAAAPSSTTCRAASVPA